MGKTFDVEAELRKLIEMQKDRIRSFEATTKPSVIAKERRLLSKLEKALAPKTKPSRSSGPKRK